VADGAAVVVACDAEGARAVTTIGGSSGGEL